MEWEISILQLLASVRGEALNGIFEVITITGEVALLGGIVALVYWCVNKKVGQSLGFMMLFSMLGNGFIKNMVKAKRPFELGIVEGLRQHTATGYSFPSGHTQSATTFWAALMIHIKTKGIYYIGTLMIVLTGLSRLYLGVHWPVDVLAAMVLGVAFTVIGQYLFQKGEKLGMASLLVVCLMIGSTLLLKFDQNYMKTVAGLIGYIGGVALERRYINFKTEASLKIQIVKVVIGFGGLMVLAVGLKMLLPQLAPFNFVRYMALTMWIIAGAPYVFKKVIVKTP